MPIAEFSIQLRNARIAQGFSQNEVATILHVTRQSISKWENGRGYPDLDNLIQLSEVYKMSIDNLLKESSELKDQINTNNAEIAEKRVQLKKINMDLYQNTDEGLLLIILTIISAIIPPVGIFMPVYVMWRNNKYNSLYKTIIFVSILVIIISLISTYVLLSDTWLKPSNTTVYQIK
ncbi:helix-turn-helix domain-containing protein [Levilactobacillus fujinensis]|uniref:Helix-turn-helix domain-containing protein n=1 Tax=Levilactobacillus fujinensis TaxID=2486024 RepID=A0ABW1TC16_9LACO|nr:helix-turn-helix transcriptional regulator [Levilactobacillus fujinensis]